jgi:ABC-type ATPase involved in cell division
MARIDLINVCKTLRDRDRAGSGDGAAIPAGGEDQRAHGGGARCITRDAALFLVDEPFANLDQAQREK